MKREITLKLGSFLKKCSIGSSIIASLFLISIALQACAQEQKGEGQHQETVSNQVLSTFTVPIEGMSCGACVSNIKKKVRSMEGITEVEVSLEHREAIVTYADAKVSPEQVRQAINELGYKAGKPEIKK
ncbi:MAG: heavy metal-associated domain-containing protein [Anditalea sp.]